MDSLSNARRLVLGRLHHLNFSAGREKTLAISSSINESSGLAKSYARFKSELSDSSYTEVTWVET